jgi:hypothetical protein
MSGIGPLSAGGYREARRCGKSFVQQTSDEADRRDRRALLWASKTPSRSGLACLPQQLGPTRERCLNSLVGTTTTSAHRGPCNIHLLSHELVMFPRLALVLDEIPHQITHDRGSGPLRGLPFDHERDPQIRARASS